MILQLFFVPNFIVFFFRFVTLTLTGTPTTIESQGESGSPNSSNNNNNGNYNASEYTSSWNHHTSNTGCSSGVSLPNEYPSWTWTAPNVENHAPETTDNLSSY
jgi:hypothetical protein